LCTSGEDNRILSVEKKSGGKNSGSPGQERTATAGTEHGAGRTGAESGTHIGTLALLQQNQPDNGQTQQYLKN
jgi:hypothetical protein